MMLLIASHYVHNSGILEELYLRQEITIKNALIAIFGMWGKPVINCFILITGYYMCNKTVTYKRYFRLILEVLFYNISINLIFFICGYKDISLRTFLYSILPIQSVDTNFVSCYLIFFLLMPYINMLIHSMDKHQHFRLLCILGFVYSLLGSLPKFSVAMNYLSWFTFVYLFAAYFRIHWAEIIKEKNIWIVACAIVIPLSMLSVLVGYYLNIKTNMRTIYYFIEDSNKVLGFSMSFSLFALFLNINIKQSKIINYLARTTFGVLLIHANSNVMREWLWGTLNCLSWFDTSFFMLHAFVSVILVYCSCAAIDCIRIKLVEEPLFKCFEKSWSKKKIS